MIRLLQEGAQWIVEIRYPVGRKPDAHLLATWHSNHRGTLLVSQYTLEAFSFTDPQDAQSFVDASTINLGIQ